MEENSNLLNETTSSWIDDEGLYKKEEELQDLRKIKTITKGAFGAKFILENNNDGKQYFAKQVYHYRGVSHYYEHIALYSAFTSCFSHTPYPICKKKLSLNNNEEDFILYRFDNTEDKDSVTVEMKKFFNDSSKYTIDSVDFDTTVFSKLSNRAKKNIIQLYIHMIFFNMQDRKFPNLLFCNNGMHHIDIDFDNFMFDIMYHTTEEYNKKYVEDLSNAFLTDGENVKKYIELEINKIKNINFETFIERYIGRCVALDVDKETAFDYLNNNFITRINEYYMGDDGINNNNNKTIFSTISEEINRLIKKGIEEVWNSFSKQMNELKYMTNKELFFQKFDEIKKETLKERKKQTDVKVYKEDKKCINIEPISIKKKDENDNKTDEKSKQIFINENQHINNNIFGKKVKTSNSDIIINDSNIYSISGEEKIDKNKMIISIDEDHTNGCCDCCGINLNDINPFRLFKQRETLH